MTEPLPGLAGVNSAAECFSTRDFAALMVRMEASAGTLVRTKSRYCGSYSEPEKPMSDLSIVRGQRNTINLPVAMPFSGAIDWSTSWLQFEMMVPGTSPPNVVISKTTRSSPNEIKLLHDDLVRITFEPGDFADVPADVPGLDWRLELHLGGFNAYELDEGFARFGSDNSPAHE